MAVFAWYSQSKTTSHCSSRSLTEILVLISCSVLPVPETNETSCARILLIGAFKKAVGRKMGQKDRFGDEPNAS